MLGTLDEKPQSPTEVACCITASNASKQTSACSASPQLVHGWDRIQNLHFFLIGFNLPIKM